MSTKLVFSVPTNTTNCDWLLASGALLILTIDTEMGLSLI